MSIRIHDPIKIHFYVRLFCIVLFPCSKCNSDVVNDAINNSWCGFLSRKIEIVIVDDSNIQSKYDRYNGTKCMFWIENIVNWAVFLFQRMFSSISSMIVRIAFYLNSPMWNQFIKLQSVISYADAIRIDH